MTDLTTIALLFNTTMVSLTTTLLSANIFPDEIVALTNGNVTFVGTSSESPIPIWVGFIGCLIASFFFGTYLVPVKQLSAGDGFFFQFVVSVTAFIVGLILDLAMNNQRFYPLALIGGISWTTGHLITIFAIKTAGLAVALLIWGTTSLITGWATGRFGLFGLKPQVPSTQTKLILNNTSVVLAATSVIIFLFIKSSIASRKLPYDAANDKQIPVEIVKTDVIILEKEEIFETDYPFLNRLSNPVRKALGCASAAVAGTFYGTMFIPYQYIRDHPEKFLYNNQLPPSNGLYYVRSQYTGALLAATFYFVIYSIVKRNKPSINPSLALPAMACAVMWAVANMGFIVAISALRSAVAFPIVIALPGIVTSLWSLFWFREIEGKRNYIFLACGMVIRCLGALLSGLSA